MPCIESGKRLEKLLLILRKEFSLMDNMQRFLGKDTISVSEAMQSIDNNAYGILFLVDTVNRIVGCITDGDIRRFLLAGGKMSDAALDASNKAPKVAHNWEEAQLIYDKRNYIFIPIVDANGVIIDLYASESENKNKTYNSINIPVVINAGGKGTRLDPFTKVLPKPLIPIGDIPIIEFIMNEFQSYSCDEFHIIVNYKKDLIKAYFADNSNHYNISWYEEEEPLGTGGGLSLLRGKFQNTFFFANCDTLLTADYESIVRFHKENSNAITMVCAYKNMNLPYGVIDIGVDGLIKSIKEKPLVSFLLNTGIYIVEPEVIEDIEDGVSIGFPDIVERERKKGRKVAAFPVSENDWMDMGQLPELERMRIKLYGE